MGCMLIFCCKEMKEILTKKPPWCFDVIPLNNADSFFLLQDNTILLCLKS